MFAIVETGGKQIKAIPGQTIQVEKLSEANDAKVSLSNVLMIVEGKDSKIGNPYLKNAKVNCRLVENLKAEKVIVYKMRPKKGTRKKQGHRQWQTKLFIDNIELDGKIIATSKDTVKAGFPPKVDPPWAEKPASTKRATKKKEEET